MAESIASLEVFRRTDKFCDKTEGPTARCGEFYSLILEARPKETLLEAKPTYSQADRTAAAAVFFLRHHRSCASSTSQPQCKEDVCIASASQCFFDS